MTSALTIADRPVAAIAFLAIVVLTMIDELAACPQESSATSNNR